MMTRRTWAVGTALLLVGPAILSIPHGAGAQEAGLPGPVVDAGWLRANQDAPGLVLLHVGTQDGYATGHIPGARLFDLSSVTYSTGRMSEPDSTVVMLELREEREVRAALEAAGASDESWIVVTFEQPRQVTAATRLLWTLQYMGMGGRSALLDGGNGGWQAEGGELTTEVTAVRRGRLSRAPDRGRRVSTDWVRENLGRPGVALVDGRREVSYTGEREEFPGRAGHIPGAGSLPIEVLFDDAGRLKGREDLAALLAEAGVAEGDTVVAYCHIGLRATAVVLAARVLGHEALLYDGSMNAWGKDPALPLETNRRNR